MMMLEIIGWIVLGGGTATILSALFVTRPLENKLNKFKAKDGSESE